MQSHTTLSNASNTRTSLLLARVGTGEAHDLLAAAATLGAAGAPETLALPLPFAQPLADDAKGSEKDEDEDEDEGFEDDEDGDDEDDEFEDEDEFEDDEDEFFDDGEDDDEFDDDVDDEDDEDEDF